MTGILIIDDSADDLRRPSAILTSFGYQISEVACDGETGITMYREKRPDLVIIDLILTEMNGIDILRRIRNEFLNAGQPYVLLQDRILSVNLR